MKEYTGMIIDGQKVVYVRYPGGSKVMMPKHVKHESEDKFDWGQSSAESLNTALGLLMNALGSEFCEKINCVCPNDWAVEAYQTFDAEFVAKLDPNYWRVSQVAICDWVFDYLKNKDLITDKELVASS